MLHASTMLNWLVEPDGPSVEVYRLSGTRLVLTSTARHGALVESALLPELEITPSELLPNRQK
jgi:Uma2 family endonuclease